VLHIVFEIKQTMKWLAAGSFLVTLLFPAQEVSAQCDPITPLFVADLTGAPDSNWFSPSIKRDGFCCSASGSDVCIQFILTLDTTASGISFNIASGAVPPGALYYQVNCGPQILVGTQICLYGPGPHLITFCKPGNNPNSFSITSIPETEVELAATPLSSPKCPGIITVKGLDEASISCTAIPANPTYDAFLSCPSGCDTITVTPSGSFPLFVDYLVCGLPVGGCATATYCDTIRVRFSTDVAVSISPNGATLCNGVNTTTLTATPTGGTSHYEYLWSTGATTSSIVAGAGTHSVTVTDTALCATATASVTISVPAPIVANAGTDRTLCASVSSVSLNGSVQTATGGLWSGGGGNFTPSNSSLTPSYTPTAGERTAGFVNLVLQTTGNQGCPAAYDTVRVYLPPPVTASISTPGSLLCNGVTTTTLTASHTGGISPYAYLWNNGQTSSSLVAGAGTYSVTVTDSFNCPATAATVTITVHPVITVNAGADKVLCSDVTAVNLSGSVLNATGGAWGGGNGSFSPSNTSLNVSYTPTPAERSAGFVNLVLQSTGNGGCPPAFDTVRVSLPSAMLVSLSQPNTVLCNGTNSINLSVSAAGGIAPYQYLWNTGQQTQGIVAGAGTFTVTVTDQASCSAVSSSVTVTVLPQVVANAGANMTLCSNGSSVNLVGSIQNAAGGLWSGGGGNFSPSNTSLNVSYSPSAADRTAGFVNLVLETTGNGGCPSAYDTVRIDLPSAIQITLSQPSTTLCNGSSNINLSATAVGGIAPLTYRWNTGQTTPSIVAGAGTYTVTVMDAASCSNVSSSVTIAVQPPLVANAGSPVTLCPNTPSVNLNGSVQNAGGGIWRGGNGIFDPENIALNAVYTPTALERIAGFVNLVLQTTGNGGCPAVYDTVRVTLAPEPSPSIAGAVMLCSNTSVNYSVPVQTGNTYYWSATGGVINGSLTSNSANITWSNAVSGTVIITETNAFGCSATQTLNISMVAVPNPVISGNNTLCQYNTETYSVTAVPGNTYIWNVNGGTVVGPANAASVAVNWTSNGTGSITVTERNPFGCEQSFQMPVTVKDRPVPVIGGSAMGCTGNTYTYETPVSANTNYIWSVMGGSIVAYNGNHSVNVTWNNASVHTVSLTAINTMTGCDSVVVYNVQVAPIVPPVIQASSLSGCPPLSVQFTGNSPAPGQSYAWTFGDDFFSSSSGPSHIYETSGTFNVVLITRNNTGCADTATATITVYPLPVSSFTHNFESGTYYVGEDTLSLTNNSTGATNYLWTFGTGDTANAFEPNYNFKNPGDYVLKCFAINEYGCMDKSLSYIQVRVREQFYVPGAFSPNGDNINDYFYIEAENIASLKITIFNRWGRFFYTSNDKNFRWDGTCDGNPVPLGVYGYLLTVISRNGNEQKVNGTVTIVR